MSGRGPALSRERADGLAASLDTAATALAGFVCGHKPPCDCTKDRLSELVLPSTSAGAGLTNPSRTDAAVVSGESESAQRPASFDKVHALAESFGLTDLPRFGLDLGGHYAMVVAWDGANIRMVTGTATRHGGRGGQHIPLSPKDAKYVHEQLDKLLDAADSDGCPS